MERVAAMGEDDIRQPYGNLFLMHFPLYLNDRGTRKRERRGKEKLSVSQLQERNSRLYEDILPEFL